MNTTSMLSTRTYTLTVLGLLLGISSYGCTYAGYCIGSRIDKRSEQKIVFHHMSTNDSSHAAIADIPSREEMNVHLIGGETFSGAFEGINSTKDSLVFQSNDGIRNVPTSKLDYVANKNFRTATKIGLFVGIGLDIVAIIEVIRMLGASNYHPMGW